MTAKERRRRPIRETIKNHIRHLRFREVEMTQQELAELVGATRQTVHAIEASKYAPSLELASRIAVALDTPFEEVFWYEIED